MQIREVSALHIITTSPTSSTIAPQASQGLCRLPGFAKPQGAWANRLLSHSQTQSNTRERLRNKTDWFQPSSPITNLSAPLGLGTSPTHQHPPAISTTNSHLPPAQATWLPLPNSLPEASLLVVVVVFSCSVMSDSLQPHGLQHTRLLCSPYLQACSNSCPLCWWYHPTIYLILCPSPPAFNLSQHQSLF